jgi:hypothetical protein
MKIIRTLLLVALMPAVMAIAGCSSPPSPEMVSVGADWGSYKVLQLSKASRQTADKTGKVAGEITVWITANGDANEAQIDAELDRLIAEEFPDVQDREAILAVKDLAKSAVTSAIENHGLQLDSRAKLVLIYVRATADGVKRGAVRYVKYLDNKEADATPREGLFLDGGVAVIYGDP